MKKTLTRDLHLVFKPNGYQGSSNADMKVQLNEFQLKGYAPDSGVLPVRVPVFGQL